MLKNLTTGRLIIILIVLVAVYLVFEFFGGKSRSKSFRETLVEIDTSKVEKLLIDKGENLVEIYKNEGDWHVQLEEGKNAVASESSVNRTLNSLLRIEPSRLVARKHSKWSTYQVDTAGTRVQVYEEGDKKTLDLIIGKFGMQNQRQFHTYVRLNDEDDVYAAENFMGASFSSTTAAFRNKKLSNITPDSLTAIEFNYPADTSFTLTRVDSVWMTNGTTATDSANTAKYTSQFRSLTNTNFVDDIEPSSLGDPTLEVILKSSEKDDVSISAWQSPQHQWIIQSTINPESYFADEALFGKIFKGKRHFVR